ncbi:hypothetical protein KR009_007989 [Drosophila setifemur]|nr:hypothetical protein KR009_007989 [Drosophila setifemur]
MVNVPPLLCSTPPPMDFGEEDEDSGLQSTIHLDEGDEFSDFGLVTSSKEPDPVAEFREKPPDLLQEHSKQTAEAFNYQVKQALDFDVYREAAPQTPPPLNLALEEEEEDLEEELELELREEGQVEDEETNTHGNVPSLKLDSLSLYSTESVSGASTLSPVADMDAVAPEELPITKANVLSHQVTLEDVSDDSDEECSPKKPKELFIREGAEDFFAIEVLASPNLINGEKPKQMKKESFKSLELQEESSMKSDKEEEPKESFKRLEPLEGTSIKRKKEEDYTKKQEIENPMEKKLEISEEPKILQEKPAESDKFQFGDLEDSPKEWVIPETSLESKQGSESKEAEEDFDDFGDFAHFAAAEPVEQKEPLAIISPVKSLESSHQTATPTPNPPEAKEYSQPDDFDDFQEFATPEEAPQNQNQDGEDDDDFGDFSEPIVAASAISVPPPTAAVQLSLDERVKPVLERMFPRDSESPNTTVDKRKPLAQCQHFNFGAVEQARALDYQWSSSEMRHALVRSLGIDSRNILFGDKWNSSMPRFAANLSFDPLKPLKPQSPATAALCPESNPHPSSFAGLDPSTASEAGQAETRTGPSHGEGSSDAGFGGSCISEEQSSLGYPEVPTSSSGFEPGHPFEPPAATPAAVVAPTAATLPTPLPADSPAHQLNGGEQLHQQFQHHQSEQEQFDLRTAATPTPSPTPPPVQEEIVGGSISSYAVPLKETHIYTPSKSDTAVAKTTTLAPIDFDYEMAATGIKIDETVVKKEYRDVEYKPPFSLDSPSKVGGNGSTSFELPPPAGEDDDFSDFQSMPAPRARLDTPTFGEQMILSPAILLPQAIPMAKKKAATNIEWGDNSMANINAEEMARIEELFSKQTKPPTISASVAKKPANQAPSPAPAQEDDEWSDFVSVPVPSSAPAPHPHQPKSLVSNNNNVTSLNSLRKPMQALAKDDEWSDFVSSTSAPQFNSGAWQSANFYNNPLSLYRHHQQQHHSNLVPNQSTHNNNNNNVPQQIHIMHDFSTAPAAGGLTVGGVGGIGGIGGITYQQQHQRQQFQIGNAKVAPRISLIPDLSFVAPALPTNAGAFMGSLPKPSFGGGKK